MSYYKVKIKEMRERTVYVEADDANEANELVEDNWVRGKIRLRLSDLREAEIGSAESASEREAEGRLFKEDAA